MSINANKKIVSEILNDKRCCAELTDYLNKTIDYEIAKGDEMDDELISDCINLLSEIENNDFDSVREALYNSEKIIRFCRKKNYARKAVNRTIAASMALILIASVVTLQVNPAFAKQVKSFFEQIVQSLSNADEQTANTKFDVKALYGAFKEKPKTVIKDESEINLDGMEVYAMTSEGKEIKIPLSECKSEKHHIENDGEKKIIMIISYGGCSFSINYTLEG